MDKEGLIAKALLAHSMERHDDMLKFMRQILAIPLPLGNVESKLLHNAYRIVCESRYQSLLKLCHFYRRNIQNLSTREIEILRSYFIGIQNDLVKNCNELNVAYVKMNVYDILQYYLIPAAMIDADNDLATFYFCMKGTHHTLAAEFAVDHLRKVLTNEAQTAYEQGYNIAKNTLPAVNSTRLRIVINYSAFICNMQQDLQGGCQLLKEELRNYELERQTGAEISATSAFHAKEIRDRLSFLRKTLMEMIFPEYEYDSSSSSDSETDM